MIKADKAGRKIIEDLCNLALKQVVVQTQANMRVILDNIKALPEKKKKVKS